MTFPQHRAARVSKRMILLAAAKLRGAGALARVGPPGWPADGRTRASAAVRVDRPTNPIAGSAFPARPPRAS